MDFARSRWARRLGFGSFYVVQGLPWGYASFALSARMAAEGRGPGAISAVLGASAIPWAIKPLAGALFDSFGSHPWGGRRFYALVAQALLVPATLALAFVEGTTALAAQLFVIAILCALQDVAGDAMAVRLIPPEERAEINGVMHAAKYGGGFIGGAGAGYLMQRLSPAAGPLMMASVVLLSLVFLALVQEDGDQQEGSRFWVLPSRSGETNLLRDLGQALRAGGWLPFLLAFSAKLGFGVQSPVMPALLTGSFGLTPAQFSTASGGIGLVACAAGAIAGGRLADRIGRRRVAAAAGAIGALCTAFIALRLDLISSFAGATLYYVAIGAASGVYVSALLGIFMGMSAARLAATHFALLMACLNFGLFVGRAAGGPLVGFVGYDGALLLAALAGLAPAIIVFFAREQEELAPPAVEVARVQREQV